MLDFHSITPKLLVMPYCILYTFYRIQYGKQGRGFTTMCKFMCFQSYFILTVTVGHSKVSNGPLFVSFGGQCKVLWKKNCKHKESKVILDFCIYLASGQSLSAFSRHIVDHLFPKLGGQLVAFRTPPLDDRQNLARRRRREVKIFLLLVDDDALQTDSPSCLSPSIPPFLWLP